MLDVHIDRLLSLRCAPGYSEAIKQFTARYEGGESVWEALEAALLALHEQQNHENDAVNRLIASPYLNAAFSKGAL